ncbi:MAG: hypothetical protein Q9191_006308 [Dirinaria sp. TL-2023a]
MSEDYTNGTIKVPYHGNCPDCHHFHTNTPLYIPQDPSTHHVRLHCDACGHPILGIGRTSTQTTLASVETVPPGQKTQRCNNKSADATEVPTLRLDPAPLQEQQRNEPLSAITETSSINNRSRSVSGSGSAEAAIDRPTNTVASNIAATEDPGPESNVNLITTNLSNKNVPRVVRWKEKAKNVTPARLKSFLMARLKIRSRQAQKPPARVERGLARQDVDDGTGTVLNVSQPPQTQPLPHTLSESQSAVPNSAIEAIPRSRANSQSNDNDISSHRDKHDRILAKRRERTVAKTANINIECDCTGTCQCRQQSDRSLSSDNRSNNDQYDIDVPNHSLGHLYFPYAGIGDHLTAGRPSSADGDPRARTARPNSRLSNATTAQGSTSSSTSLNTGRPLGRSSSSVHGPSARQPYR